MSRTRMKKMRFLVPLVLSAILVFSPTTTSKTNSSIAKPSCDDHCGDVSIPFPYGLTEDCALNSEFFINCTTSPDGSPKPLLGHGGILEVRKISVEGQLVIMSFITRQCSQKGKSTPRQQGGYQSGSFKLYVNQTANKFVAVGCDTFANVYAYGDDRSYRTGSNCMATCNSTQDVTNGTCSGFGCCETEIPNVARNVYYSVDSLNYYANTTGDVNNCSYAFVVQKEEFTFSSTMLTRTWDIETLPMVLDWTISNQTCTTACRGNTRCVAVNDEGYRCGCKEGYQGNPYLSPGCQDIDECANGQHNCSQNAICSNTKGGYECSCKKGYHGNGKGALGCTSSNHRLIMLVLGIALGTIMLLISCCCVYLVYRRRKSIQMKEKFFRENGGLILQQRISQGTASSGTTRIFTAEELRKATNNYDQTRIIGQGGFGRRAVFYNGPVEERSLSEHFLSSLKTNQLFKILVANIVCEGNTAELQEIALLAKRCLNVRGEDRPTMKEVAMELGGFRRATKHPWTNNSQTSMESQALLIDPPIHFGYDGTFSITTTEEYDSLKHHMELPVTAGSALSKTNSSISIAKSNCTDSCGNVMIPYPFGLTEECSLNSNFSIACNSSYDPPKPYLPNSNIEISDISVDGQLTVMKYIARICYSKTGEAVPPSDSWLTTSNFYVNQTANKFVAVGCDAVATVSGSDRSTKMEGCRASCDGIGEVKNGTCSGIGCCETAIPNMAKNVYFTVGSIFNYNQTTGVVPCNYAFVVKNGGFDFSSTMLTKEWDVVEFPMVLDWFISNETCNTACQGNTSCVPVNGTVNGEGYRCGYIDECVNGQNNCSINSICSNIEGSYECHCEEGYHGDGKGELGCQLPKDDCKDNGKGGFCLYLGYRRRKSTHIREKFFRENGGLILKQKIAQGTTSSCTTRIFTDQELRKATNNYDQTRIIGQGGFGVVYKGHLLDGRTVAVKKPKMLDPTQVEQFINEVIVLSQINHRNIVKLFGCCLETEIPLLVYEFINNGTLSEHLNDKNKASALAWPVRLRIATETAETHQLTEKSDVYSFGVVLMELLTGRRAVIYDGPMEERSLYEHFLSSLKTNQLFKILDDNIVCEGNTEELQEVAFLARRCLNVKGEERPTMKEVAVELSGLRRAAKHSWVNNSDTSIKSHALFTDQTPPISSGYIDATFSITSEYDSLKHHMELPMTTAR
nr:putative wall-associated receptor kinase-like 16 [Ipomoea batatas]